LAKALSRSQILVNASTTSFYGASGKAFDEKTRVEPISLYGQTKYAAEQIVMQRENSVSLRFATVFGVSPRMRNDLMVNDFVHKAMAEKMMVLFAGHSKRTFVHIRDAAASYVLTLGKAGKMRGQIYNVGDEGLNFSKMEIARAIQKQVPCEVIDSSMPTIDKRNFVVSFKKIQKLGYKTKFTLEDGIRELVKLYGFYTIDSQYKVI
ncbi:MAG: SDR family oxidoreductase, partial [Elusimicrobia bacterium]|nr:SDR family oxidoreductase [Elusimicrobiota bacterium]